MALPEFSMRQLLEAGVHFGHQTHRWDPKMKPYIFGERNGIHIVDLSQTVPLFHQALVKIRDVVAGGGRVLFVGTKRQAQKPIAEAAQRCAQYYMNVRWLGGTLTNWQTISASIRRLKETEERLQTGATGLTKKEQLQLGRELEKLNASLGGIRELGGLPDILFVIDVKKEAIAVREANKLGIPVVAIVDTNCSPDNIDYIIPGNDDASRAIALYCSLAADAVIDGISASQVALGVDVGSLANAPREASIPRDFEMAAAAEVGETAEA
jgi:small subunit ribosomal protein S2